MAKSSRSRKVQNESGWSKCLERTRSKDPLIALSLCIELLELHFGLQRTKEKLFDLSGKSWPKAGHPNLPTSEASSTLLSRASKGEKKKGEGGGVGFRK